MKLSQLNGWYRAGMALSVIWLGAAIPMYFSNVEFVMSETAGLPSWAQLWYQLFPLSKLIPLYDFSCSHLTASSWLSSGESQTYCVVQQSDYGLACFVLYPIGLLWMLGFLGAWVFKGFQKQNN